MAGFNSSVLEAIGNTPIVELNRYGAGVEPLLLAKLEFTNPGGSMKDRAALGMIEWAEREHDLQPGAEIIISTSGNLGIGMAMICVVKGYHLICLVDPKLNPSTERSLELMGAELVKVDEVDHTGGYHLTRLKRLETVQAERPNAIYLDQYDSPAAVEAHRTSTGAQHMGLAQRTPMAMALQPQHAHGGGTNHALLQQLQQHHQSLPLEFPCGLSTFRVRPCSSSQLDLPRRSLGQRRGGIYHPGRKFVATWWLEYRVCFDLEESWVAD